MPQHIRLTVLILLGILVLVVISFSANPERDTSVLERGALEFVAALQHLVTGSARAVENLWLDYFYLINLRQENKKLNKLLSRSKMQLNSYREAEQANRRLAKLLKFSKETQLDVIGAQVIGWSPGAWFKTININRGSKHGLRNGLPVISDSGIVGRIIETAPHFAKVLLIIDYNSAVDAFIQRSRVRGMLAGRSEKVCALRYVLKNDDLVQGDVVITSGMGGIFPKGLPLGTINRVKTSLQGIFMEVEVIPAVDFNQLEEVLVVLTEEMPF